MNVGIVVPGFSASESDWCIPALASLVRRLAERHRVRVFALRYPYENARYAVSGAEVHALGGARARGLARISLLRRAVSSIGREHRREPFDVLHAIWADEPGYVAVTAARALGIPSVVTLFGGELVALESIGYGGLLSRLNRLLVARALARASRVTAGSTASAERARPWRTARLLPIGVDLERFHPGERQDSLIDGAPRLLHVASLVPVKDQATLLEAFARIHRVLPRATLNVVGEGPLEGSLRRLSRELGIENAVVFHGAVRHEELPFYYRSSDLLVMSSLHEGQELVVLEAGACGRTTVGTRVGVVPDLEPATIAVRPKDPGALAGAVRIALADPCRLREMETLVRRNVVERYALSATVSSFTDLYAELGDERARRVPEIVAAFRKGVST